MIFMIITTYSFIQSKKYSGLINYKAKEPHQKMIAALFIHSSGLLTSLNQKLKFKPPIILNSYFGWFTASSASLKV